MCLLWFPGACWTLQFHKSFYTGRSFLSGRLKEEIVFWACWGKAMCTRGTRWLFWWVLWLLVTCVHPVLILFLSSQQLGRVHGPFGFCLDLRITLSLQAWLNSLIFFFWKTPTSGKSLFLSECFSQSSCLCVICVQLWNVDKFDQSVCPLFL